MEQSTHPTMQTTFLLLTGLGFYLLLRISLPELLTVMLVGVMSCGLRNLAVSSGTILFQGCSIIVGFCSVFSFISSCFKFISWFPEESVSLKRLCEVTIFRVSRFFCATMYFYSVEQCCMRLILRTLLWLQGKHGIWSRCVSSQITEAFCYQHFRKRKEYWYFLFSLMKSCPSKLSMILRGTFLQSESLIMTKGSSAYGV